MMRVMWHGMEFHAEEAKENVRSPGVVVCTFVEKGYGV